MAGLAQSSDHYQNFRFAVATTINYLTDDKFAGFQSVTLPEHNVEPIEYNEGIWSYSRYMPGRSHYGTVTLARGVVPGNSKMADWIRGLARGNGFRCDLIVYHVHRDDVAGQAPNFSAESSKLRRIICKHCMPIRYRPGSDFDAMSPDMSVEELEVQVEYWQVFQRGQEGGVD